MRNSLGIPGRRGIAHGSPRCAGHVHGLQATAPARPRTRITRMKAPRPHQRGDG